MDASVRRPQEPARFDRPLEDDWDRDVSTDVSPPAAGAGPRPATRPCGAEA